jgi:hypothetical protein
VRRGFDTEGPNRAGCARSGIASLIVAAFPALFCEFRGKHFTLRRRDSRDAFGARDFDARGDGHANLCRTNQLQAGGVAFAQT